LIQEPVKLFKDDENEEDKKKKKKKKANNVKSISNRAPLSNNSLLMEVEGDESLKVTPDTTEDEADQDYDHPYFDEQENVDDSPLPVLEYSLVIEETNLFYLFLLQNDLSSFPFVTSTDSINSYREDLFTPLNNLLNHFIGIREKLNNIMHERCFYDQTKEYFSEKRKLFFQSNPTNAAKFDFFQVISTLLARNAKNSNQTSELFDHGNNLCYFWIFHSYFLDLIFVPYVESFYSFLDNHLIIDSANQQSATTPTFSSSLENWFIHSKAKEVYFQQLIEKRPIAGTSSSSAAPDISTATITFPDNIQFIKSLLLVDYFIVVIEEFLFKIFAILSVLFQQSQSQRLLTAVEQENSTLTGSISTEMEVDNMMEGLHNSATQEEKSEETVTPENNIYFLHEFVLVMINFLNNYTKYPSEPNVLLEDEQEHRNYGQRRIELKEFIFSLLKKGKKYSFLKRKWNFFVIFWFYIVENFHNNSLFSLTMTPRIIYQLNALQLSTMDLKLDNNVTPAKLLMESSVLFKRTEKDLTKKEKLAYLYHYNETYEKMIWSHLLQYVHDDEISVQAETEVNLVFEFYFPFQNLFTNANKMNVESFFGKEFLSYYVSTSSLVPVFSTEEKLWIMVLFFVKSLLEIRKKDMYHFQSQYRISLILYTLSHIPQEKIPNWVIQSLGPEKQLELLTEEKESLSLSELFFSKKQTSEETLDQENQAQIISTLLNKMVEFIGNKIEGEASTVNTISGSQKSKTKNTTVSSKPPAFRIKNTLLLSFLGDISRKKSLLEMHKLFDRRLPQIINMWHDQAPDNAWEKVSYLYLRRFVSVYSFFF
jgi:hypothetical protein